MALGAAGDAQCFDDAGLAAANEETLARLVRVLDYAEGFTLFFARCNLPAERQRWISEAAQRLRGLAIEVVALPYHAPVQDFRHRLRADLKARQATPAASAVPAPADLALSLNEPPPVYRPQAKTVVFITGLEHSIPYDAPSARLLAELNLGRELFARDVPHPLVLWLPDYALTAVARHAPDFWAWRSGVFEFETAPPGRAQAVRQYVHEEGD